MEGLTGVHAPVAANNLTAEVLKELTQELEEELSERDALIADVWVGVVLTLMILSCVCCVCSCFVYHKFQQWKHAVLQGRVGDLEAGLDGANLSELPLPSYTLVSGLPTYDEALEQLKQMRQLRRSSSATKALEAAVAAAAAAGNKAAVAKLQFKRLSVGEILNLYRSPAAPATAPASTPAAPAAAPVSAPGTPVPVESTKIWPPPLCRSLTEP